MTGNQNKVFVWNWLGRWFGFPDKFSAHLWIGLAVLILPLSFYLRFHFLSNPVIEPHPWRQSQTALSIYYFFKSGISLDYRSPLSGKLWNYVHEFPLYQAVVASVMRTGLTLEIASRLVTLFFFFGGALLVFLLARDYLGKHAATWTALFYLASPFNVIFSRVCLIDFPTLFFMLLFVWLYLKITKNSVGSVWLLMLATLSGLIAGAMKVTVWYVPIGLLFLYTLVKLKQSPQQRGFLSLCLASLLFQLIVVASWVFWANKMRGCTGIVVQTGWFFGGFAERLNVWKWKEIGTYIFRNILHDWMVLPFLAGIFLAGERKGWIGAAVAIIVLPIMVMFNIHWKHDYYLIALVPYIIAIAGLGMSRLLEMSLRTKALWLGMMIALFSYRFPKLSAVYGPIFHDYRTALNEPWAVRELSSEKDVIYMDGRDGRLEIPLYSQRLVATFPEQTVNHLNPSLFKFDEGFERMELLAPYPTVWIVGDASYYMYRTQPTGPFNFNIQKQMGVSDLQIQAPAGRIAFGQSLRTRVCGQKTSKTYQLEQGAGLVGVYSISKATWLIFPKRSYLYLPSHSEWGCDFEVSLIRDTRHAL
ncbi:MAG: glycosyltransferase family 39 protein [Deltaproteobacteria bacterium]|nr:glycosyltransferase family 39 protein [Deltaproteobacteria bacterium]